MEKKYIVGIDFGHGETSAWIVPLELIDDQITGEALKLKPSNKFSDRSYYSAIYFTPNNGYSLDNMYGDVVTEFKNKVSTLDKPENSKKKEAYKKYIQEIYERLLQLNDDKLKVNNNGETNFYLCIACPTKWNQDEKSEYINFFNIALEKYKAEVLWVINESDAAYFTHGSVSDYKNKCVLIIDYGSSTIDYTVVYKGKKISDDSWSNQLGANNIEASILEEYRDNDDDYQLKFQNTLSKLKEIGSEFINIYSSLKFSIRKAKEASVTQNYYPNFDLNYNLIGIQTGYGLSETFQASTSERKKYKFEIECQIDKIESFKKYYNEVINDFKELNKKIQQKIGNKKIDSVILSGGACQMPWVKKAVEDIFCPLDIIHDGQASFVVAKGIALYARAQLKALEDLIEKIKTLNFYEMYIKADSNATAKAVNTMMPYMTKELKSKSTMTGIEIRQNFCDFVENLNEENLNYCNIVQHEFDFLISNSIRSAIKSVIQSVFKVDVDVSDVNLHTPIKVINWEHSLFVAGGTFYDAFTNWIDNSSDRWIFTWDKQRYGAELSKIVDGTAKILEELVNSGQIASYPQEVLNTYSERIKEGVIENAVKIFYNKQLFNTTFKSNGTNDRRL